MRISISVIIDSVAGAGNSLYRLLHLFGECQLKANFFVSTGPDRNAPPLQRLRGRNMIANEESNLLAIRQEGHHLGLGVYDPVSWKHSAGTAKSEWIDEQWKRAIEGWQDLYNLSPDSHAAAGFQVHSRLFSLEQQAGMRFSSDVYGKTPFLPELLGNCSTCMQLPVTLPSETELMESEGVGTANLHQELFDVSQKLLPQGQHWRIVSGHSDPALIEAMIAMWRGSSREFVTMPEVGENVLSSGLKQHRVGWHEASDGRYVAMQSLPFDE